MSSPVNVRLFGAIGNGSTDDTSAFEAAIAAAGTRQTSVYVPRGTYAISRELVLASRSLRIHGDGWNHGGGMGTKLKAASSIRSILNVDGNWNQVSVEDMELDANQKASHAMYLSGAPFFRCKNVYAHKALLDGIIAVTACSDATQAINDGMRFDEVSVCNNGKVYVTDTLSSMYGGIPQEARVGTVSITNGDNTVTGTAGVDFTTMGIRTGDFIHVGMGADHIFEIQSVTDATHLETRARSTPTATLAGQQYAVSVGNGYYEERHNDNNCAHFIGGLQRNNACAGLRFRGLYGPLVERVQPDANGLFGIVVGGSQEVIFCTVITSPYFEEDGNQGGCIYPISAYSIQINQPVTLGSDTTIRTGFYAENYGYYDNVYNGIITPIGPQIDGVPH